MRTLSMRPASIGPVKHLLRGVDLGVLRQIIEDCHEQGAESVRKPVMDYLKTVAR
jgi:phosphotransferase system enzyme I (PtsP)